jgi:hypothetical protein
LIDFRYHLVSIIAVFLALAVGIAVGAEAVSPQLASTLRTQAHNAAKSNNALYAENSLLKKEIGADELFAQAASGSLLTNLLVGERVALITAPGADTATVNGISSALTRAGATVTGTVALAPQFFDVNVTTEADLTAAATALAPPHISSSDTVDAQIAGQQAAAKVIAAAIMDNPSVPALTSQQTDRILTGFGGRGFLQVAGSGGGTALSSQASLAVVVIPGSLPAKASSLSPENLALIYLTHYLQQAGKGAVLAGSLQGSGSGSAIDAVTSGDVGVAVTTIDNADTETGQIIVAQALSLLLSSHPPAAYGAGPDAVPSPAPTASPTPTSTPSKTPATKKKKTKTVKT